ncbi:MAG: exodeoxyribonuclease VII large subunit [Patescibacteria group bacterium]
MNSGLSFNFDESNEPQNMTVAEYLTMLNNNLKNIKGKVIGEVVNLKLYSGRSYLYFSIKDKEANAVMNCFMWKRSLDISGIELADGLEVAISGFTKIYEPNGSISFQTETIALVGEGALKKAYDKLKQKLEKEGLMNAEKKRPVPEYPHKIGVITSKDGAVISDFTTNIGKFGYEISFVNSRVEGQIAITDLIAAVRTLKNKDIDVLVIMRGGGSLESFAAFNNEMLVREIADFPAPVIAGIGHDKDICLVSLVADHMVSTPTAVTQLLNKSWEQALSRVLLQEKQILNSFTQILAKRKIYLERAAGLMQDKFTTIFERFKMMQNSFTGGISKIGYRIKELQTRVETQAKNLSNSFIKATTNINTFLNSREKELELLNPERQLKLGYSIVRLKGKALRDTGNVKIGDELDIKTYQGELKTEVKEILK